MPTPRKVRAGTLADSLTGLENWSNREKSQAMAAIADDIRATFICISQHVEAGNLSRANTEPIDTVIEIIHDTEIAHRRALEQRVRRLRKQRRVLKQEFRKIVSEAEALADLHTAKLDKVARLMDSQQKELQETRQQNEMWKLHVEQAREGRRGSNKLDDCSQEVEDPEVGDVDAEWEHDPVSDV